MIDPIQKVDEIDEKILAEMSKECIRMEYLKKFFATEMNEIFLLMITQEQVVLIRAANKKDIHHQGICNKVFSIMGGSTKTLLVHAISNGKDKYFIRNFAGCSRINYCKNMKEIYDLFENFINRIKPDGYKCSFADYGLSYDEVFPNNNEKDRKIYGVPLEEVRKILKENIHEENGDEDYDR